MKIYNLEHNRGDGFIDTYKTTNLTAAKLWMKRRPGSKGFITKVYANGDWEPCGEIKLKGSNAVQMSNQTTATY